MDQNALTPLQHLTVGWLDNRQGLLYTDTMAFAPDIHLRQICTQTCSALVKTLLRDNAPATPLTLTIHTMNINTRSAAVHSPSAALLRWRLLPVSTPGRQLLPAECIRRRCLRWPILRGRSSLSIAISQGHIRSGEGLFSSINQIAGTMAVAWRWCTCVRVPEGLI